MSWRLGADLGANSLGWAAIGLDEQGNPSSIIALGSRIFSDGRDPKSGASLAVDRRAARSMRRRRDRFKQRQRALIQHLARDGLFPSEDSERKLLAGLDPYVLRARALDEALTLYELGRALFHLNQRRGFQSNRKADRSKNEDAGKVAIGIDRLKDAINQEGARTFGEFLHLRRARAANDNEIPSVRTRLRPERGDNAKGDGYDFYPGRQLLKDEFDEIWEAQRSHHPQALMPDVHDRLFEIIFNQRPLKTPLVGMCTLVAGEPRLPKAHPLFQRRRLFEELNALTVVTPGRTAERLTPEQRDLLLLKLKDRRKATFESLRRTLKLDPAARFNKESEHRAELKGDEVAAEMAAKNRFGTHWLHLSADEQWEVIKRQLAVESDADEAAFVAWITDRYGLAPAAAKAVAGAHLPPGYGRFGCIATKALIEALTHERDVNDRVIVYSEAVKRAGLGHHSDMRTGQIYEDKEGRPALPYYGVALERHIMPGTGDHSDPEELRVGRLTNPTVHIGLNQLRRVVNALVRTYGPPAEIAIELARELKLTDEEKKRRNRENNENRMAAERRTQKLLGLDSEGNQIGHKIANDTGANRALLKLWEELDDNAIGRECIYSGQIISPSMLFDGRAEVDHILPFSATLDDSMANRIVCLREANRLKRKRSPFDAKDDLVARFGPAASWEAIAERASRLPRNKRWRFEPDAMQRFSEEGGFLARHLKDTQYLGRLALEYLSTLYSERGEGSTHVWVSPGRLTEMVRRKLGLNTLLPDHNFTGGADQPKNRLDHRHHAIDAAVVALLDRGMLSAIARASSQGLAEEEVRIRVPEPWDGFRDDLHGAVNAITVAHRLDHGQVSKSGLKPGRDQTAAALHNDTAYGLTRLIDKKGVPLVVRRIPITAIKPEHLVEGGAGRKPAWVADPVLRARLAESTHGKAEKDFAEAVRRFSEAEHAFKGVRRVRLLEPTAVIKISDNDGRIYKGYKGDSNYRYDVWELPVGTWRADVVSMFDAHQTGAIKRPHPAAKKVLSLHRDDMLAIERTPGVRELVRVVKFSEKQLAVAPPNESGALKSRDADKGDPFKYIYPSPSALRNWRARQVRVDELGRVFDPGFPARKLRQPTSPAFAAE